MQTGLPLSDIRDAAGKAVDNMARLAALFHIFEGERGNITESTVNRAVDISRWYLNSYKCLYGQQMIHHHNITDAQTLRDWIFVWLCKNHSSYSMPRRYMRQHCPNVLRKDRRLEFALNELIMNHQLHFVMQGKVMYVVFNMSYFQPQPQTPYCVQATPALMRTV
jgi:hypothetical protein